MIFRVEKTDDFTIMSNYHLRDRNLSLKAKGLLSWMLSNSDDWDYSLAGIVACCKEGETTVNTALRELQQCGYVVIVKHKPDTDCNRIHYDYVVYEKPQGIDSQELESQALENQTQINTNTRNTKKEKNNSKELLQDFPFGKSKSKKPDLFSQCVSILDSFEFSADSDVRNLLIQYLKYRIQIKDKPLYANMWKGMLNKLQQLCKDDTQLYESVIQQSIERGYLAFYPVNSYQKSNKYNMEPGIKSDAMTEEDYLELERLTEERRHLGLQAEF